MSSLSPRLMSSPAAPYPVRPSPPCAYGAMGRRCDASFCWRRTRHYPDQPGCLRRRPAQGLSSSPPNHGSSPLEAMWIFHITSMRAAARPTCDYEAHIRDLIEQVLFTSPGERVNRPDFGSGLLRLVFAPNSDRARRDHAVSCPRLVATVSRRSDPSRCRRCGE